MDLLTFLLAGLGGLLAGFLTTVAGVGGGLTLIALLSGFTPLDPKEVVGLTAPVLLLSNAQRAWLFRGHIERDVGGWFLVGAVPTVIVAAATLPRLPARAIQVGIALLLLTFVAERLARRSSPPAIGVPLRGFVGVGAASGVLSATVGGSGPFSAPFFNGYGLARHRFVGTNASVNAVQHLLKTFVFALVGVLTVPVLPIAALAAVTSMVGNKLGELVLDRISERVFVNLLLIALTVAAIRLLIA